MVRLVFRLVEEREHFFPAFIVGLREMHLIVEIVFDRADPERKGAALSCLRDLVDEAAVKLFEEWIRTLKPAAH